MDRLGLRAGPDCDDLGAVELVVGGVRQGPVGDDPNPGSGSNLGVIFLI